MPGSVRSLAIRGSDERWPFVHYDVIDRNGVRLVSRDLDGPEPQGVLLAPGDYEIDVQVAGVSETPRRRITIGNAAVELSLP